MKWFRRKPLPAIPPYQPPVEVKPQPKEDPGIIVDEVDTSAMTSTGVFKTWQRRAGRRPKGE